MSNTENLGLKIPTLAEKNIHTTYVDNNDIIDEAYGQYLEDKETAQENIAMIESSTAQSNHTTGSYFMLDNILHKATSNIASGEDIVSGSNATPITIEQVLMTLNSSVGTLNSSVSSLQNLVKNGWRDDGEITDFNSTSSFGIHAWNPSTYNKPNSDYGVAITFTHGIFGDSYSWLFQLAFGTDNKIYFRSSINNSPWSNWITLH